MQNINYLDFSREYKLRGKDYVDATKRVLISGHYVLGPETKKFESDFAHFCGMEYCVGVGNGLEAIEIALRALGVGKNDEVITTPISAVATTLAIIAVGAIPVFVDIKEDGQIDENLIEGAITKKTKAILPVHLYGQPARVDIISKICKKHNLFLVEDCAQAHGTKLRGKRVGTFGDIACYSFYPTKNLGAIGDGGAIVTNKNELFSVCSQLRDYGQESKYVHSIFGLNSRLDELQSAILKEKLKHLDADNNRRRLIAGEYVKDLSRVINLRMILPEKIEDSVFHLFVVKTKKRDELKDFLYKSGIQSLVHYPITIPDQPLFENKYKNLKIPVARRFVKEVLSLPCYPFLKNSEVKYVTEKITKFFNAK